MGVIIRQSFWTSVFSYLGVALGYVNTLLLLPTFFTPQEIGLYNQVQSAALLLVPVAALGMGSSMVKFFPLANNSSGATNSFVTMLLGGGIVGIAIISGILLLFKDQILWLYLENTPEVADYFLVVLVILGALSFSTVLESFAKAKLKIVIPNFLRDVFMRLLKAIMIVLFGLSIISFEQTINSLGLVMMIFLGANIIYVLASGMRLDFTFSKVPKPVVSQVMNYSLFAMMGSLGNVLIMNVDIQMVSAMLGNSSTGVYSIAFYLAIVIDMPRRAISQISAPLIAKFFEEGKIDKIKELYKKLALNQLLLGGLLLVGLVTNIYSIYAIIPNSERFISGITVVYIIGLSRIIDMGFSVNGEIILMSKHYRFNIVTVVCLGLVTIASNYFLIPLYGIDGAAIASLLSILIFNIVKAAFVKWKFGFFPFSWKQLIVIVISFLIILLSFQVDPLQNPYIDIIFRSVVVVTLYLGSMLILGVSADLNHIVRKQIIEKLLKRK